MPPTWASSGDRCGWILTTSRRNWNELTSKGGDVDVVINLTYDVSTEQYLRWCVQRGVPSVDTSVEMWDPYDDWAAPRPVRGLPVQMTRARSDVCSS